MKKNKAYYILASYIIGAILLLNSGEINQNFIVPFLKYVWKL